MATQDNCDEVLGDAAEENVYVPKRRRTKEPGSAPPTEPLCYLRQEPGHLPHKYFGHNFDAHSWNAVRARRRQFEGTSQLEIDAECIMLHPEKWRSNVMQSKESRLVAVRSLKVTKHKTLENSKLEKSETGKKDPWLTKTRLCCYMKHWEEMCREDAEELFDAKWEQNKAYDSEEEKIVQARGNAYTATRAGAQNGGHLGEGAVRGRRPRRRRRRCCWSR